MSESYKFNNPEGMYFITAGIVHWIDLFTRQEYVQIVLDSFKYCIKEKGLIVHAWCIMPNHLHAIISRKTDGESFTAIMRDFKSFTSREMGKTISYLNESRKEWLLRAFRKEAETTQRAKHYKIWQDGNHPEELDSNKFIDQKLNYIHQNPVKAGFVWEPHHWRYSSACDYAGIQGLLPIALIE